jgi:hypothetical protein
MQAGRFVEAGVDFRKNSESDYQRGCLSMCFVMAFDLVDEYWKEVAVTNKNFLLSKGRVLDRERDCRQFTPWQQGFTPKEHKVKMVELEEKKWRAEQERNDREYRDEQRRKDEEFRIKQSQDEAAWRKKQERHFVVEIVLGAVVTAVLLCLTQLYCTWWQVSASRQNEPQTPRTAAPETPAPLMPSARH